MIVLFRVGPVFYGAFLTIFVGVLILTGGMRENLAGIMVMGAIFVALAG
jgi:hypothetical protein